MSFSLIQSGTALQALDTSGNLTSLTLPTGVTLSSALIPRFAVSGRYVVMVNSPSRPITIDGNGTVRVLTPRPPGLPLTLVAGSAGALSGTYKAVQTFRILDTKGNVIAESDYSPPMTTGVAIASKLLQATGLDLSTDTVSESRLYRTTTGGSTYFPWISVDGNTQTSSPADDLSDAGLGLIAAPKLGAAPDLSLIAEWRGRLWGVSKVNIDHLVYTETGMMYAWPTSNDLLVPREGSDARGVTALIARREVLGVGRRNILHQVTGNTAADFRLVKVSENVGIESQETVKVYRDAAYFLWKDGVYKWDTSGVTCISDSKVRSWFASDSYFNRGTFSSAFALLDPLRNRYLLFLCSAGSSTIDRWVEYNIEDKTWWGPHKTDAFTPSCSLIVPDANDTLIPMIGSTSGFLWQNQSTRTDGAATAIDLSVTTKFHDGQTPDIMKYWGQPAIIDKVQSAGTLTITPYVGGLNAVAGAPISHDLTLGRERLRRLGDGRMVSLNFRENTAGQDVELFGYELPFHELGRR